MSAAELLTAFASVTIPELEAEEQAARAAVRTLISRLDLEISRIQRLIQLKREEAEPANEPIQHSGPEMVDVANAVEEPHVSPIEACSLPTVKPCTPQCHGRRTTAQKEIKPKKPTYREKLFSGTPCLVAPKQQAFTVPDCDDTASTISYVATYLEASGPKAFSSLAKETGIPEGRLNPLLESATQFTRDARGFWWLKSQLEGL